MSKDGLRDEWEDVQNVLSQVIPVYDKVNKVISLWQDVSYRTHGVRKGIRKGDFVLDAGCGPGVMSEILLKEHSDASIILFDPIRAMLEVAGNRVGIGRSLVSGVFEKIPFPDGTFDAVMCGYSIRDAKHLENALLEISRVLKPQGGRLVIVDLGKPDNYALRMAVGAYWHYVVPILATIRVGRRGMLFSALYKTYRRHPKNSDFKRILQSIFREVKFETRTLGASAIITASK